MIGVFAASLSLEKKHLHVVATLAAFSRPCRDWLRRFRRAKRFAQRWRQYVVDCDMGWHCAVSTGVVGKPLPSVAAVRQQLAGDPPHLDKIRLDIAWRVVTISAEIVNHEATLAVAMLWRSGSPDPVRSWALARRLQDRVAVCFYVIADS